MSDVSEFALIGFIEDECEVAIEKSVMIWRLFSG